MGVPVVVRLIQPAGEDLTHLLRKDPQIVRWALKKMLLLELNPQAGEPLHGSLMGWRKLVVGDRDWRLIWRVSSDRAGAIVVEVAEVWAIGARSDSEVYQEAHRRVTMLPRSPLAIPLADVIVKLGRISAAFEVVPEPSPPEPLPPWLVGKLTDQAGIPMAVAKGMTLEEAISAWERWMSGGLG